MADDNHRYSPNRQSDRGLSRDIGQSPGRDIMSTSTGTPILGPGGEAHLASVPPPRYYRVSSCLPVLKKGHIVFGGDLGW